MKHIELFAGCGGMSLGLEKAGYKLIFANELSPMAGETFAYNLLKTSKPSGIEDINWVKSKYPKLEMESRLRENPDIANKGEYTDINEVEDISGKLIIGDINNLLDLIEKKPEIRRYLNDQCVDLLSGGPPCQSFSLAGKRVKDDKKNTLPLSFARFAGIVKPKVVLLENVKGILSAFHENGRKFHAWLEVSKAFALQGYVPVCMLLNSKYFGVAQNRPRFILFAYRKDIFQRLKKISKDENEIYSNSWEFFKRFEHGEDLPVGLSDLKYYDIENNPEMFDGDVFPKILTPKEKFVTASDAIGDLRQVQGQKKLSEVPNGYAQNLNKTFKNHFLSNDFVLNNHEPRSHRYDVKARFRFYQVINEFDNDLKKKAIQLFTGKSVEENDMKSLFDNFSKFYLYFQKSGKSYYKKPENIEEVKKLISSIPSKKHTQRALREFETAPAQLTIPDDLCHYHMENLRTLTVREMARFQSFPDWFTFRSKITTGGKNRRFEVPQYTQVGNAVPPLLALALGKTIKKQLKKIS